MVIFKGKIKKLYFPGYNQLTPLTVWIWQVIANLISGNIYNQAVPESIIVNFSGGTQGEF